MTATGQAVSPWGEENALELDSGRCFYSFMKILKTTELYTLSK